MSASDSSDPQATPTPPPPGLSETIPVLTREETETVLRNLYQEYQAVKRLWEAVVNARDAEYAVAKAQAELATINAQVSATAQNLQTLTDKVQAQQALLAALPDQATVAQHKMADDLAARRAAAEADYQAWSQGIATTKAAVEADVAATRQQLDTLRQAVVTAQQAVQAAPDDAKALLQKAVDDLRTERDQIQADIQRIKAEVAALP